VTNSISLVYFLNLKGKAMSHNPVVIVTGASRGIGAFVARWLGKVGARVILIARSPVPLERVGQDVGHLGGVAFTIPGDVADEETCRRTVEKTIDRFGHVDALVNNAGIFQPMAPLVSADTEAWRYNIQVNLLGPFHMAKAAIPHLLEQKGRIINVGSGAANIPVPAGSAYCASKAAVVQFTRVLATEEPSLTVLAVRPGVVDTEMQAFIRREGARIMSPEQVAYYKSLKTEGKLEPPAVPARSIAWLSLHAPRDWSGQFLNYDDTQIMDPSIALFGEQLDAPSQA
jgi:NAD(P)-dependent dehydrogenase (short-subunit alcohol dehydrogenase family)